MGRRGPKVKALPCDLGGLGPLLCGHIYSRARSLPASHTVSHPRGCRPRHRSWRKMGKRREEGRTNMSKLGPRWPNGVTVQAERQREGT